MNLPDTGSVKTLHEQMDILARAILTGLDKLLEADRNQATALRLDFFAAKWLKIRTKKAGPAVPFALNWVQADFLKRLRRKYRLHGDKGIDRFRGIRANVLKPRQLGFSTFIAALFFVDGIINPGRTTVVVTHLQKMSLELIKTYRLFWAVLPPEIKNGLVLEVDSKYEFAVAFPSGPNGEVLTPSRWIIWTEKGEDWRGGVIHNLHGSEAAFYSDYMGWKTAFYQAVDTEEGNIILETTANGMNSYYDDVQSCLRGESSFDLVFYSWHIHPEYRRKWDPAAQPPLTDWEIGQMALHGWTLDQLAWRRWKVGEIGSEERFRQEFPATVDEAFLQSGRPFFPMETVKARLDFLGVNPSPVLESVLPFTTFWEAPIPGETYMLSADIAEGLDAGTEVAGHPDRGGTDSCCGYVIHARTLRVVAMIHGRIPMVEFSRLLDRLGRMYGACIAPERNNHGHTTVHVLESAWYPWLYRHLEYDTTGKETFLRAGFPTDPKTRPQILDALWQAIKAGLLICPDPGFWRECQVFHRNAKTGKPKAIEGYHDDRVMALAIGVYLCTLGRSGWGLPSGEWADATGMPVSTHEAAVKPPAPPPPEPPAPTHVGLPGLNPVLQAPRPGSCGTCEHFLDGSCHVDEEQGGLRLRVNAEDPGCWAHRVRHETPKALLSGFGA